jgi:sulfatase modifying factor 1
LASWRHLSLLSLVVLAVACGEATPAAHDASGMHRQRRKKPKFDGPCMEGMALVASGSAGRFCVDKWEASLFETDGDFEEPFSPYEAPDGHPVRAESLPDVVPQAYISRDYADYACRQSSKRLCTEEEWQAACQGDPPHAYPYGDVREKGTCNDSGISPLHVYYAEAPETYQPGPMNDPRLNRTPHTIAKTGEFEGCTNHYGVFDMVGNLHEWVMSRRPTFRGGYYQDTIMNGPGCFYATKAHGAEYHDYSTGFRCCAEAR